MKHRLLDLVVLLRDLPEHGLRRGDLGTVVELYEPDGVEVEFLDGAGDTKAVLTLSIDDTQPADDHEIAGQRKRAATA